MICGLVSVPSKFGSMSEEWWSTLVATHSSSVIRRQAFNTIQNPYANANKKGRGRIQLHYQHNYWHGGWVATRKYELDSED
jgi:meiotically up-regulated gene 157 (Mug157) protein